jgi:hypothetical protein
VTRSALRTEACHSAVPANGPAVPAFQEHHMNRITNVTTLVVCGLAAALCCAPAQATYRDTSAGGACQPAAGNSFTRGNNYITNIGTSTQYVICHFAMADAADVPTQASYLYVSTSSTIAGSTINCTAQTGGYYLGVNHVGTSNARSYTFPSAGYYTLQWDASQIIRSSTYSTFTLNCRMDPGTRMGLIEYWD